MNMKFPLIACAILAFSCSSGERGNSKHTSTDTIASGSTSNELVWSLEKANEWQEEKGWLIGCNYTPSTAINQLEMWQEETFDPETIERELG